MTYVALLRGINVGGNNKVEMARLKTTFEQAGLNNVKTFINSGNVIFTTDLEMSAEIVKIIEENIFKDFGFHVPVIIRSIDEIQKVVKALPDTWVSDTTMRCEVMFLWPDFDSPDIMKQVPFNPAIEDVNYIPGALFWRIDRANVKRGKMLKIIGTGVYKNMTMRNCNSVRKIYALMKQATES